MERNEIKIRAKKILFIFVAALFFVMPWIFPVLRGHAPGAAVFCGILFALFIGNPFEKWTGKLTSNLLGLAIVGMGCGMNFLKVLRAGADGILFTLAGIVLGLGLGIYLGKKLKIAPQVAYLTSVGTSICGGSAIAAAAPVLKSAPHEIALSSAVVFSLNAVALFVFPAVGKALNMDQEAFGYWAALGIHDTSSVVGATLAYGQEALEVGTTIKLARALWIVPVTIFLSICIAPRLNGEKQKIRPKVPWFIPCFLVASALVTFIPVLAPAGNFLKDISKYLMILTLFLIGSNLNRDKLKQLGIRPVIHGVILWVILAGVWCFCTVLGIAG